MSPPGARASLPRDFGRWLTTRREMLYRVGDALRFGQLHESLVGLAFTALLSVVVTDENQWLAAIMQFPGQKEPDEMEDSARQNERTDLKLAHAGLPTRRYPLIQRTLGDIVTLSLGGGQGNGTTDPSAHSDHKGHEVGTRSAEPPRLPLPSCGTNLKPER
jgi:hypothetical protein